MRAGGSYVLVYALSEPITIEVGALGEQRFPAGGYCYVGNAPGSGGFSRIDRHRRVAAGEHDVRYWHVDYFGAHPGIVLVGIERVPGQDCECALARELGEGPVTGFGASDCDCVTHLTRFSDPDPTHSAAEAAVGGVAEPMALRCPPRRERYVRADAVSGVDPRAADRGDLRPRVE